VIIVCQYMTPCSLVNGYWCFVVTRCLVFQGRRVTVRCREEGTGTRPVSNPLGTIGPELVLPLSSIYRVSQEERTKLRDGVPYVKLYRYNPKHLCPKLNGYWDNSQIKLWTSFGSTNDTCQLVNFIYTARRFGANSADARLKCISLHMSDTQAGSQQAEWSHRSAFQCDV